MTTLTFRQAGHRAGDLLFSNLNLTLGPGDRLGLVAPNGRGKSTLLRALAGELDLSEGDILRSRGTTIGYMPQDVPPAGLGQVVRDFVASGLDDAFREEEAWRADMVLAGLDVPPDLTVRPLGELSGGWQRLALIARAAVREPDVLLLDEPTNHLDLQRILMLERWLEALPRSTILVIASHDRSFLDAATNRTLFLRPSEQVYFPLSFSPARMALEERDAAAEAQRERELRQATQLRRQAAKLTNIGINSGSDLLTTKAKQLRDRAGRIEESIADLHKERTGLVRLGNSGAEARVMLAFENVAVATPDGRPLFTVDKLHVFQGDRIVVLGRNGAGKSQLLTLVHRALHGADIAGLRVSPQLVPGYLDQALSDLPLDPSPLGYLSSRFDHGDRRIVQLLAGAGFPPDMQARSIARLSLGQRARLSLLALRMLGPNFYLLDEPTNHLDIPGQEQLEADLGEEGATTLAVSHDRAFVRGVGTRFFRIGRRRLEEVESPEPFFAELQAP